MPAPCSTGKSLTTRRVTTSRHREDDDHKVSHNLQAKTLAMHARTLLPSHSSSGLPAGLAHGQWYAPSGLSFSQQSQLSPAQHVTNMDQPHVHAYPIPKQHRTLTTETSASFVYPSVPPPPAHSALDRHYAQPHQRRSFASGPSSVAHHPNQTNLNAEYTVTGCTSDAQAISSAWLGPSKAKQSSTSRSSVDRAVTSYFGYIKTSTDAVLLLAACDLPIHASTISSSPEAAANASPPPRRINRRLLESERADLIKTGSVFVWDEAEAGMRRWTDGRCWSASRVSGCFLTYRELEVRKRSPHDLHGPRANQYKVDGLIKQSFSMTTTSGRKLHIVSYYTKRDLREGRLRRVSEDPRFVGEAGGEWGLEIDEVEFPDPVLAVQEQAAAAAADASQHAGPQLTFQSSQQSNSSKRGAGEETDKSTISKTEITAASSRSSHITSPALSAIPLVRLENLKRARSREDDPSPTLRPPLKRLRSSSAGELLVSRQVNSIPEPPLSRQSDHAPELLTLTECNMRGAAFTNPHLGSWPCGITKSGGDVDSPVTTTSPSETEQDNAAGALLSLRSSYGGSFQFTPAGSASTSITPMTSPEEKLQGTLNSADLKAMGSTEVARGSVAAKEQLRAAPPERSLSDKYVLSKLSVRL